MDILETTILFLMKCLKAMDLKSSRYFGDVFAD